MASVAASAHEVLNVLIDVRPVNREACSCLGSGYALVCFVEPAKHGCTEAGWDEETASRNHEVIVNAEAIFNSPILLHWFGHGVSFIWESSHNEFLEGLVFWVISRVPP